MRLWEKRDAQTCVRTLTFMFSPLFFARQMTIVAGFLAPRKKRSRDVRPKFLCTGQYFSMVCHLTTWYISEQRALGFSRCLLYPQRAVQSFSFSSFDCPCGFSFAIAPFGSGQKFLRDFTAACRKMSPLVEFTTRALSQKY